MSNCVVLVKNNYSWALNVCKNTILLRGVSEWELVLAGVSDFRLGFLQFLGCFSQGSLCICTANNVNNLWILHMSEIMLDFNHEQNHSTQLTDIVNLC